MSYEVARFLERGRTAGPEVSALDAVMGEDWAVVEPGRTRRGHTPGLGLRNAHRVDVQRCLSGGMLPGRKPQAVVKMIRKGGASDVRGLRAQMAYLSRDGAEPLQRSEAMMGIDLDVEEAARLEKEWRMPPEGADRADRTSHFIVSFPEDSLHASSERAGRAWAEEMFGSGQYGGDSYDYYTAFHTDRAHPHMHVIVYRRGLEHGAWLKVSQRGDLNYDRMREVLVDVADREGIELEATTRLARGLHDRPVPDAEYRRAVEEDREPEAPEHSHHTAIRAAASLIHFSRQFAADARAIERDLPDQAKMLHGISERLSEGRAITSRDYGHLSPEGEQQMADRLEEVTAEVRGKFERLDNDVVDVEDDVTRVRFLRQIGELKANTVPYMRDPGELREFAERDDSGRFEAIVASDPLSRQVKISADDVARDVARDYGLDPDATVERYSGAVPSRGLARQFADAEERERAESRALSGIGPESVADRDAALAQMRVELQNVYREGRDIVQERYAEMAEVRENPGYTDRDDERLARDGLRVDEAAESERFAAARDREAQIVEATPWYVDGEGTRMQYIVARSDRGFHPGFSRTPSDRDELETRHSDVAVATAVEAMALVDTFVEDGDRGVREQLARERTREEMADRQMPDAGPAQETKMSREQERILRDLERDTDDYDR